MRSIHIELNNDLFSEFQRIHPEHGMISFVIRKLLSAYINSVNTGTKIEDIAALIAAETEIWRER